MKGLEEYENKLLELQTISKTCIGEAIYEGAGVVADAVKANIEALPIDNRRVKDGKMLTGINEIQKQGLREGFGIAKMQNEGGYVHVKLGFDGYNGIHSNSYPNGQPNSVIARSVNSGSSFRQRIPFVDSAVNANREACVMRMVKKFNEVLEKNF